AGPEKSLGKVSDIRLKELFDVYLARKTDQIRRNLGEQNSSRVQRYLLKLATFMFHRSTSSMDLEEVVESTGDADLSGQDSLYLHLLDEDIIIEEQPGDFPNERRVAFVYEEFMEYLLASAIYNAPEAFGITDPGASFEMLDALKENWTNARGVGEYVCLMLLSDPDPIRRYEGVSYLRRFTASSSRTWREAYWSVLGKLPESSIHTHVFDTLALAFEAAPNQQLIKQTLTNVSRFSTTMAGRFAAAILWSAALPTVLTWEILERLPTMGEDELASLESELVQRLNSPRVDPAGRMLRRILFDIATPFLSVAQKETIDHLRTIYGSPAPDHLPPVEETAIYETRIPVIKLIWKAFPEFAPMLLNGLYDRDESVRRIAADRIRWSESCRPQLARLTSRIAEELRGTKVGQLLSTSAWHLSHQEIPRS
ncbi:MAG TPA: hypothetical protein VFJ82_07795, partial [Longimicrobium sp.]|nr:hypothetical protein [Longimicrobium sp.]